MEGGPESNKNLTISIDFQAETCRESGGLEHCSYISYI